MNKLAEIYFYMANGGIVGIAFFGMLNGLYKEAIIVVITLVLFFIIIFMLIKIVNMLQE